MPAMDAKYLGAFMLLSTQNGWAKNVFGNSNFDDFKTYGLNDQAFLDAFYKVMTDDTHLAVIRKEIATLALTDPAKTPNMKDIHSKLFQILTLSMAANVPNYTTPPCPTPQALITIIKAVNNA